VAYGPAKIDLLGVWRTARASLPQVTTRASASGLDRLGQAALLGGPLLERDPARARGGSQDRELGARRARPICSNQARSQVAMRR
jgi:hypothetical protein